MVHRNTFDPTPNPLNAVVGLEGLAITIVPVPLIKVQVPVPTVGVLPANVVEFAQSV